MSSNSVPLSPESLYQFQQDLAIHVDFLTRVLEDDDDPQYWRYTEYKRRKKEFEEDIEADLIRKDGFFGLVSKSGGARSSRKAPAVEK